MRNLANAISGGAEVLRRNLYDVAVDLRRLVDLAELGAVDRELRRIERTEPLDRALDGPARRRYLALDERREEIVVRLWPEAAE